MSACYDADSCRLSVFCQTSRLRQHCVLWRGLLLDLQQDHCRARLRGIDYSNFIINSNSNNVYNNSNNSSTDFDNYWVRNSHCNNCFSFYDSSDYYSYDYS